MPEASTETVSLEKLLKLRLAVARFGEMDNARWWNTKGILGALGRAALQRGFPQTHYFAQARIVFEVARARSHEVFDPPGCVTLWHFPTGLEDRFDTAWHDWLDKSEQWRPFFETIAPKPGSDLSEYLLRLGIIRSATVEELRTLKRSAENRAVAIPGTHSVSDQLLELLAAAFSKGETGALAVPYARVE
jgi:hypothetical protein